MREMTLYGVSFEPIGKQPIVLLKTVDEDRFLPIWIGQAEAAAILMRLQGATPQRPMTHDLLTDVVSELNGEVVMVTVTLTTSPFNSDTTSVSRSCVIGRCGVAPWSRMRIAAASACPIQMGRKRSSSTVFRSTMGCLPIGSKLTP